MVLTKLARMYDRPMKLGVGLQPLNKASLGAWELGLWLVPFET